MAEDFDRMAEFERYLHDRFGERRPDPWPRGVIAERHFNLIRSVRPDAAMRLLGVSRAGLVDLILSGKLPRPRIIRDGEVEWRKSEIETEGLVCR
jgi:predicted DNA-binding transcriptional regulator AlpA